MGYYINKVDGVDLPKTGKVAFLVEKVGAEVIHRPKEWMEDLVCVVLNQPGFFSSVPFEAAGYCFDADEFEAFSDPSDPRRKWWLKVPNARQLAD